MRIPCSRGDGDCAIAALSAVCGVPYPDVVATAARLFRRWRPSRGLRVAQMQQIASALGTRLRWRSCVDLASPLALLVVPAHVVVLRDGRVLETNGSHTTWDVLAWLRRQAPDGDYGALIPV